MLSSEIHRRCDFTKRRAARASLLLSSSLFEARAIAASFAITTATTGTEPDHSFLEQSAPG
jgi:hypothetical protein